MKTILRKLVARLTLIKISIFGDKELEKTGFKMLMCVNCGKSFRTKLSYGHKAYGITLVFDNLCEKCRE